MPPRTSPSIRSIASYAQRVAWVGGTAILPDRLLVDSFVECNAGRISRVGPIPKRLPRDLEIIDASGQYIAPGLIDIHVHGGAGADFMDGTPSAIATACRAHLQHGTTTLYPTTTTGSEAAIHAMIDAVGTTRRAAEPLLPHLPGIHLYGPYFTPEKSGCHKKEACRTPTLSEFDGYFKTGLVKIATCAAELEGAIAFYRHARKRRCLVTCGHSNASWSEMAAGHKAGMSHVDHFWCAMSSVASVRSRLGTPMQGSMLEFVLAHPTMSTEVIADGYHLAPELLQFAWQIKGPTMLCLVSDTSRAMDMPEGKYAFGHPSEDIWIVSNGHVGLSPSGGLASSVVPLIHCVRHMAKHTAVPLHDIFRMASLTPAERTGIEADTGSLSAGKRADLLVLSKRLEVQSVVLGA